MAEVIGGTFTSGALCSSSRFTFGNSVSSKQLVTSSAGTLIFRHGYAYSHGAVSLANEVSITVSAQPSHVPTFHPSPAPTVPPPTPVPSSSKPTFAPTSKPSTPTSQPSSQPQGPPLLKSQEELLPTDDFFFGRQSWAMIGYISVGVVVLVLLGFTLKWMGILGISSNIPNNKRVHAEF